MVSIPACHPGDPGSIPGNGVIFYQWIFSSTKMMNMLDNKEENDEKRDDDGYKIR